MFDRSSKVIIALRLRNNENIANAKMIILSKIRGGMENVH